MVNKLKNLELTIIIFGASGDLSTSKLIPALYNILKNNKNIKFALIGAAYEDISIDKIFEKANKYIDNLDSKAWNNLKSRSFYQKLDFSNLKDFVKLNSLILEKEKEYNLSGDNRLAYLAAPAHYFCDITKNLVNSGIIKKTNSLKHKVVYEKPFGWDLKSACKINKCIKNNLNQDQVYRVDHYLAKNLVNAIKVIRFTNIIFEPIWNKNYIDEVQVVFSETENLQDRGSFFDKYGILKDVVQNHCLQILSLIAMDKPKTLTGYDISKEKAKVLNKIEICDVILGQFKDYTKIRNVKSNSNTPTYAAISLNINNSRWKNTPFYIKAGKALKNKATEVYIKFKSISKDIFKETGFYCPNWLVIKITPDTGINLELNSQKFKPDGQVEVLPINLNFCYKCLFDYDSLMAYEVLLIDLIKDNNLSVVYPKEIENSWKIIEDIESLSSKLFSYKQDGVGPKEASCLCNKKVSWCV